MEPNLIPAFCNDPQALIAAIKKSTETKAFLDDDGFPFKETEVTEDGTLKIDISGALCKQSWFGSSYEGIERLVKNGLRDDSIENIILEIDSPGGMVSGLDNLTSFLRQARGEKNIVSHIKGSCCSAAYAIAASTSKIYSTARDDLIGSIGVMCTFQVLSDTCPVKEYTFTSSNAKNKVPNPETEAGKKEIQSRLDFMEDIFVDIIAKGRYNDSKDIVNNYGNGSVFFPQEALDRGMIDGILTDKNYNMETGMTMNEKKDFSVDLEASFKKGISEGISEGIIKGVEEERSRVLAHLNMGIKADMLEKSMEFIKSGASMSNDEVISAYLQGSFESNQLKAGQEDTSSLNTTQPKADTSDPDTLEKKSSPLSDFTATLRSTYNLDSHKGEK